MVATKTKKESPRRKFLVFADIRRRGRTGTLPNRSMEGASHYDAGYPDNPGYRQWDPALRREDHTGDADQGPCHRDHHDSMTAAGGASAVSDDTMSCPIPSVSGLACIKHIPEGWAAEEGRLGGHWWESPATTDLFERGAHVDAIALVSGRPASVHMPADCPPQCAHYEPTPGMPGSVERGHLT